MCIMEVRAGQRTSTIAQAMAHNSGTLVRDLEMLREVVKKRDPDNLSELEEVMEGLETCYRHLLHFYGETLACELGGHHDSFIGNERDIMVAVAEEAADDIARARRYETR